MGGGNIMLKLVFYVPENALEDVKSAVFGAGAGQIGHYQQCCWQVLGEGQFMPLEGSNPYLGNQGILEKVAEYRVEMLCMSENIDAVICALKAAHPYEEPAYDVWELLSL